jgi:iron complex outermembrane receptor protein
MCRETTCFCIIFSSLQLGGGIEIKSRRGGFSSDESWAGYGNAEAGYGSNASSWNAAVFAGFHNHENWLDFAASLDRGDDYEFDGGVVAATEYDREQYRFGYGHRFADAKLSVGAVINRTDASGTPALPMDMRFVDSEQYSLEGDTAERVERSARGTERPPGAKTSPGQCRS